MNAKNLGILILLAMIWGASFLFMRVAAPVLGPYLLVELRVGLAVIALIIYALIMKQHLDIWKEWKKYLFVGAINAAIPFTLISYAEIFIPASLAAILNATTPLFTAIIAWIWIKESLTLQKVAGLLIGFIGVFVLVGWTSIQANQDFIWAVLASLLAAALYGVGTIYAKRNLQATPLELSIGQLLASTICIVPMLVGNIPSSFPSISVISATLALSLLSTAFAYLLYFHLLNEVGATQTLYVTFLVPVFGSVWGVIFLDETITTRTIAGLGMIILSIFLLTHVRQPVAHPVKRAVGS